MKKIRIVGQYKIISPFDKRVMLDNKKPTNVKYDGLAKALLSEGSILEVLEVDKDGNASVTKSYKEERIKKEKKAAIEKQQKNVADTVSKMSPEQKKVYDKVQSDRMNRLKSSEAQTEKNKAAEKKLDAKVADNQGKFAAIKAKNTAEKKAIEAKVDEVKKVRKIK